MAVEYTFAITPPVNADGSHMKVHRTDFSIMDYDNQKKTYSNPKYYYTAGSQWGLYNGSTTSNFSFGGLQMCFFHLSGNPQGNSMCMRMLYSGKPFENTAGGNDRAWIEGHGFFGSSSYNTDVQTLTVNRGVTVRNGEGAYNRVDIDVLLNRVSKAKINNDGGSSEQKMFYTLDSIANDAYTASSAADAFFGMPSTVYAIRIYSDTLTDAQMKQNHAVDLMAYFGLDVRGFAAAAEAKKTAVYEAFAAYTFNDADKVAEMQAAIDAAVAGIPVAEGVQVANDGTALRIWASMDTAENVSKLGLTVVFKKDGVVVSEKFGETNTAFESITSAGKTVTAEELRAELLYAAVVKGIPAGTYTVEVTPYVVMMDETTVTGETKTMDLTFGG
jgi:hypothetical protein